MKQLEAEPALLSEAYFLLAVYLSALLGQWSDASVRSFGREIDCLVHTVDEEKHCHTFGTFREYYILSNEVGFSARQTTLLSNQVAKRSVQIL